MPRAVSLALFILTAGALITMIAGRLLSLLP
ncbi:hypothetical protein BJ928_10496 [Rhizobium sp. WW_1]|jgi:hypothetical protein|nr:hypothetical protein BJ928_10496 [Rhizobium sp. WW_1]